MKSRTATLSSHRGIATARDTDRKRAARSDQGQPGVRHPQPQNPPREARMTTIITGNFEQLPDAQKAWKDLLETGFTIEQMTTFFVRPAAEPDHYFEKGLPKVDDAAVGGASGAAVGAAAGAVAGLATLPLLGPAAVAVAGAGAYVGSFAGAMLNVENKNEPEAETPAEELADAVPVNADLQRKAGTLLAVAATAPEQQYAVIGILRAHGATDLERTEGQLSGGRWTDFDPLAPLRLLAG